MKQSKIKVAVTGGIGSGKSLALKIINSKGYPTFSCDEIYRDLLLGGDLTKSLAAEFGNGILNADGTLNRGALSKIVFEDSGRLKKLNEITHPEIFKEMFRRAEVYEGLVFFEVPLLFDGGYQNLFDKVIVIEREVSQRISSVIARDGLTEEEVKKRIEKQYKYNLSNFTKYYVTHNSGVYGDFVAEIDNLLLQLAK